MMALDFKDVIKLMDSFSDETGWNAKQASNEIEMDQIPNGSGYAERQSKNAEDDDDGYDDDIYEPPVRYCCNEREIRHFLSLCILIHFNINHYC